MARSWHPDACAVEIRSGNDAANPGKRRTCGKDVGNVVDGKNVRDLFGDTRSHAISFGSRTSFILVPHDGQSIAARRFILSTTTGLVRAWLKLWRGTGGSKSNFPSAAPATVLRLRDQLGSPRGLGRCLTGVRFSIGYAPAHHETLGDDLPIPAITVRHDPKLHVLM